MLKLFLIVGSSLFWIPACLFILVCVLTVVVGITFILLAGSLLLLLWLLKTIYLVRGGILLARQELIRDIGQELNTISWWRLTRLTWKKYKKRLNEEQIEKKLKEDEKEIDYD